MSKQIYVQAQSDHIETMFKGSALSALEELIWNALDADAKEVKVDLITNPLGAVDAVRVADDGTGIDILKVDETFGNLGGSWKRASKGTVEANRRLHGRYGRGRFKAFSLGMHVEWRTIVTIGGERMAYRLFGDADSPGVFNLEPMQDDIPSAGTEVYITNIRSAVDSLLDASQAVQYLASKFALYLKSYPDVRIYFNGLPVTPVIVQKRANEYTFQLENGQRAKLEVIEWKRKFVGSGKLILAGPDGFELHEQPAGVRSGTGASFTAYLLSPRFPALHAENQLIMDELNPEVRRHLDEAKKIIKAHFLALGTEKSVFETEWEEKIEAFSKEEKKILLSIIKRSLKSK